MSDSKMRRIVLIVSTLILIFLTITAWMIYRDWSYFETDPYIRESELPAKVAVIYYSRSGKTEAMARQIARRFDAELLQISDQSYYQGPLGMLRANRDAWFKKPIPIKPPSIDLTNYRLIFLGSPIWWYRPAPPLWSFVKHNDFKKNGVVLFNTFNSRFKDNEMSEFKDLVEKQGGLFLDHVYVRRGRIYSQLSGKELMRKIEQILDAKEEEWRNYSGREEK
jgi:flavodoxin